MTKSSPLTVILLGLALSGCSTLEPTKLPGIKPQTAPGGATVTSPASRILSLWQPGEGDGIDGSQGRGFVGQIYFFTADSPSPITVDGDVRIFVFDNLGTSEEQARPVHQFDFNASSWQGYQTESALGPCYNVYIPYTRKGRHEADCELRIRLTRPGSTPLFSELAQVHLTGFSRDDSVARRIRESPEYRLQPEADREWQGQVTTIGVQKAGRLAPAQDTGTPSDSSRSQPATADHAKQAEITRLENKLKAMYRQRSSELSSRDEPAAQPRQLDRPENAVPIVPTQGVPTQGVPEQGVPEPPVTAEPAESSSDSRGLQTLTPASSSEDLTGQNTESVESRVETLRAILEGK